MDGSLEYDRTAKLQAAATMARQESGALVRLERLQVATSRLEDAAGQLTERLAMVLRPEQPGQPTPDGPDADSELTARLGHVGQRLWQLADYLEALAGRVDL